MEPKIKIEKIENFKTWGTEIGGKLKIPKV